MRITTRLTLVAAAILLAVGLAWLMLIQSFGQFQEAKANFLLADQIHDYFLDRTTLRDHYLLYRDFRTRDMWEQNKRESDRLLKQARRQFHRQEDLQRLDSLAVLLDENASQFERIVANTENLQRAGSNKAIYEEFDKRLVSQLLLKVAVVHDQMTFFHAVNRDRIDEAFRRLVLVLGGLSLALSAIIIVASLRIGRSIRQRLLPLHDGVQRVAEGRLDFRLSIQGDDEFAELSQSINAMTGQLERSTAKLAEAIGQRLVAAAQLENEKKFRNLLDNLSSGVVVHGPDTAILFSNPMASQLLGLTIDQLMGKTAIDSSWCFLRDDGSPMPLEEYPVSRVVATGQGIQGQVVGVQHPDRPEPTWVLCHAFPVRQEGEGISQIIVTFSDISHLRQAEQQQAKLQAQLNQAQKMDSLGSLAGGVAHDMNNVLGAILGLASAHLEVAPAGTSTFRAFETITKAATRGRDLVKGLLSFARKGLAEDKEVDLNTVLLEEIQILERTTLSKVHMELDLASDLLPIRGDASALSHAFMNLCVNAVEAIPDKGTLSLQTRNLDQGWVEVVVQDSGTGMPKDVLDMATDPFFTTKETGKGTGMGLALVFATVKAHQGELAIESEVGQGTLVRLRFPACAHAALAVEKSAEPGAKPSGRGLEVLVVDDDELIQSALHSLLDVLGHTATQVSSGEEALAKLEAGFDPDGVILDLNMPGLGGAGTLPRLRALRPHLPVLLATGRVDQTALNLAKDDPLVSLLPKPFSVDELKKGLEKLQRG